MPQFRDFQAAIIVDGAELPEYTIDVSEEEEKISCYIPSEAGKDFAVRWRDLNLQRGTVGSVLLDGVSVGGKHIYKTSNSHEVSKSYIRVTSETVHPFCFSRLSLTDDESCANSSGKDLGEVRIELHELLSYKYISRPPRKNYHVPGVMKIHEHSKKAMTHCVGYGNDTKKTADSVTQVVKGRRLATFVFRYRALDMLQAQGIAPPPQPVPSTQRENKKKRCKEEDTNDILFIDDGEADEARLKALKAEIGDIEARLRKRQKTVVKSEVKSEDKLFVIANEVIELE